MVVHVVAKHTNIVSSSLRPDVLKDTNRRWLWNENVMYRKRSILKIWHSLVICR